MPDEVPRHGPCRPGRRAQVVTAWLDEHTDGTLEQMASDLKVHYPDHPEEMAVVMRGMMAAELRHRTSPAARRQP
jgi:hypothetical protein